MFCRIAHNQPVNAVVNIGREKKRPYRLVECYLNIQNAKVQNVKVQVLSRGKKLGS